MDQSLENNHLIREYLISLYKLRCSLLILTRKLRSPYSYYVILQKNLQSIRFHGYHLTWQLASMLFLFQYLWMHSLSKKGNLMQSYYQEQKVLLCWKGEGKGFSPICYCKSSKSLNTSLVPMMRLFLLLDTSNKLWITMTWLTSSRANIEKESDLGYFYQISLLKRSKANCSLLLFFSQSKWAREGIYEWFSSMHFECYHNDQVDVALHVLTIR